MPGCIDIASKRRWAQSGERGYSGEALGRNTRHAGRSKRRAGRRAGSRTGLRIVQALTSGAGSMPGILLPVVIVEMGGGLDAVGLLGAVFGLATFLSNIVFGRAGDLFSRKKLLLAGILAAAVVSPLHWIASNTVEMGLVRFLFGIATGILPPCILSMGYDRARASGSISSFGALGWAGGSMLAATVTYTLGIYLISMSLFLMSFIAVLFMKDAPVPPKQETRKGMKEMVKGIPASLAMFMRHTGAMAIWSIFPLYILSVGGAKSWVGWCYGVNQTIQFFVMPFIDRWRSGVMISIGLLSNAVSFGLLYFTQNFWPMLFLQVFGGLGWAGLYTGGLNYVNERSRQRSTATGIFSASVSLANIFGPLLGGFLAERTDYSTVILVGTAASFCAIPVFWVSSVSLERYSGPKSKQ